MFFDIDADLVYTRPHMTQVNGRVVIIEQNILVRPTHNWKRIHISSPLIAVLEDSLNNLIQLFDIDYFGQMFAASAFETYQDINDKEEPFLKLVINTELINLGSLEHANYLWESLSGNELMEDTFDSYEYFIIGYSSGRYGIIIDEWFENEQGEKVTHNTEEFQELGGYHEGTWYSEGYRFSGFKNINDIKNFNPETGKRNKASLEKVIKKAIAESKNAAYEADKSLDEYYKTIDVESYIDWHDGRIRFFQSKFGQKSALYQKLISKASKIGHAIRKPRMHWDMVKHFLGGAVIGYFGYLGIIYISKLFD